MGYAGRPFYAWYADMDLGSHLWEALRLPQVTVEVMFHDPVTVDGFGGSRKALAQHCRDVVSGGMQSLLSGRAPVSPPPEDKADDEPCDENDDRAA